MRRGSAGAGAVVERSPIGSLSISQEARQSGLQSLAGRGSHHEVDAMPLVGSWKKLLLGELSSKTAACLDSPLPRSLPAPGHKRG